MSFGASLARPPSLGCKKEKKKEKKTQEGDSHSKKKKTMFSSRHPPPTSSGSGAAPTPTTKAPWLSRLPLPLDALLSAASVAAGLALFCAFSFKGMRAYEETARHMRYSEDPVLRALFLAHKVSSCACSNAI